MLNFTQQERLLLCVLAAVFLFGSAVQFVLKKYPHLTDIIHFMESDRVYAKVDLNTATKEELVSVPYIGEYTAGQIILYRKTTGLFTDLKQLKSVKGIKDKNFEKFKRHLKIIDHER